MKEKTLIYLCLTVTVIGIIVMFLGNKLFQVKSIDISNVTTEFNFVQVKGEIVNIVSSKSETVFIKVADSTGTIDVVVFKGSVDIPKLTKGMHIEVLGKPNAYKGKIEIIANQIQLTDQERV